MASSEWYFDESRDKNDPTFIPLIIETVKNDTISKQKISFRLKPLWEYVKELEANTDILFILNEVGMTQAEPHEVLIWLKDGENWNNQIELMKIITHEIAHKKHTNRSYSKEKMEAIAEYVEGWLLDQPEWVILVQSRLLHEMYTQFKKAIDKGYNPD